MNEIENLIEGVDTPIEELDYILPDDYEEETEESADEIETEEESEESTTEEVEDEESKEEVEETEPVELGELEINVLGEITKLKDIPTEELQPLVQMGKDYGRVKDKLNVAQEEINAWKEVSEVFDMDPQTIRNTLMDQHFNRIAEDEGRKLEDVKREYNANRKSLNDKMYERFVDKYPDVKIDALPQNVLDSVKAGQDLVSVYESHLNDMKDSSKNTEIAQLKEKLAAYEKQLGVKKQNKNTKKKGVVKKSSNSGATDNDDFLAGLNGTY